MNDRALDATIAGAGIAGATVRRAAGLTPAEIDLAPFRN